MAKPADTLDQADEDILTYTVSDEAANIPSRGSKEKRIRIALLAYSTI